MCCYDKDLFFHSSPLNIWIFQIHNMSSCSRMFHIFIFALLSFHFRQNCPHLFNHCRLSSALHPVLVGFLTAGREDVNLFDGFWCLLMFKILLCLDMKGIQKLKLWCKAIHVLMKENADITKPPLTSCMKATSINCHCHNIPTHGRCSVFELEPAREELAMEQLPPGFSSLKLNLP